jgi:hypothetical protein
LETVGGNLEIYQSRIIVSGLLHSLSIEDMLNEDKVPQPSFVSNVRPQKNPVYVIRSQLESEAENLLEVKYAFVARTSKKYYKNVDNEVDVTVSKMVLTFDRQLIARFVRVGLIVVERIAKDFKIQPKKDTCDEDLDLLPTKSGKLMLGMFLPSTSSPPAPMFVNGGLGSATDETYMQYYSSSKMLKTDTKAIKKRIERRVRDSRPPNDCF